VKTYLDDKLINSEKFKITKNNFTFEFEPQEGTNKLNFKIVDKHNNFKNKEVIITNKPLEKDLAEVLTEISKFENNNVPKIINSIIKSSKIESTKELLKLISDLTENDEFNPYLIAAALKSAGTALQFKTDLLKIADGNIKLTLSDLKHSTLDNKNSEFVLNYLISESNSSNYSRDNIVSLLNKYIISKYKKPEILLSELNSLTEFNVQSILQNMDESALSITSMQDFSNYFYSNKTYSNREKEIIKLMINGINISIKLQKDNILKTKEDNIITKRKTNENMMLFVIGLFLIFIFIFIYYMQKKKKH
nr:hypothetical protein [Bacteroidales bacterium]